MTQALAIVGAVTGITGAVVALTAMLRDRPRLIVTSTGDYRLDGKRVVRVSIANHGRQPITIVDAGLLRTSRRRSLRRRTLGRLALAKEAKRASALADLRESTSVVLSAFETFRSGDELPLLTSGQVKALILELPREWQQDPTPDVVVPFAKDSRDRIILGAAFSR